jgi:hypothetical protein
MGRLAASIGLQLRFQWRAESEELVHPGPWSEPESCALRDFILGWRPAKIASLALGAAAVDAGGAIHHARRGDAGRASPRRNRRHIAACHRDRPWPAPLRRKPTPSAPARRQWCGCQLQYADALNPAMITLELPYDPTIAFGARTNSRLTTSRFPARTLGRTTPRLPRAACSPASTCYDKRPRRFSWPEDQSVEARAAPCFALSATALNYQLSTIHFPQCQFSSHIPPHAGS